MGISSDTVSQNKAQKYFPDVLGLFTHGNARYQTAPDIIIPIFQQRSCDPFTPPSTPCRLGPYVNYAINVSNADDVAAGFRFATNNNLRLIVKNTGHDFVGRSTGAGALSLWTHNLKTQEFLPTYRSDHYNGPAVKFGAGVQVFEAYEFAHQNGVRVVGGTCPTVGIAGGYTLGGGHGMVSSEQGLSADNALEWELVLPNGTAVTATPTQNSDLYWALSGGSPGSFGVILSLTVRAVSDVPTGGANMNITATESSIDSFWHAVAAFHELQFNITMTGGSSGWILTNDTLQIVYVTLPKKTEAEVSALLTPFVDNLKQLDVQYTLSTSYFDNFYDHANLYLELPYGVDPSNVITGSRLIPRSVVLDNLDGLVNALRNITSDERFRILGLSTNVSNGTNDAQNPSVPNSVLPAWRDALLQLLISGIWDLEAEYLTNWEMQTALTEVQVPQLENITPGSGSYPNEGNFQQPDYKEVFYGENYDRLLKIKQQYDPESILYGRTSVGSDQWVEQEDGRLCRL
ncbi:MAG: hypothetical protein M1821_002538 [Bathelium mastoideum]|nr:MAG: hypothetical protein M1821_002538 [Bathelium mastoideum]